MRLWLDDETRSAVPIKRGHYRYAVGADGLLIAYAVDNGPIRVWDALYEPVHPELEDALIFADEVWACNAQFDRHLTKNFPNLVQPETTRWRCMMVRAYLHGLPGKLDKLCSIFKLPEEDRKLDGANFIELFCKPRRDGKFNDRSTHPKEWEEFKVYAGGDIRAMRALDTRIPKWNATPHEWALWHLDQERNDRGFAVDLELAETALAAVNAEKKRIADLTWDCTGGAVDRPTQRDKLLGYLLAEHGVQLLNMQADTLERCLEDPELAEEVKELLRLRLNASKSSSSKYKRALESHVNGRIHGSIQFAGAQRTARDAGRILQPQNMARLDADSVRAYFDMAPDAKLKGAQIDEYLEQARDAFKGGYAELVLGDGLMSAAGNVLRGVIVATPGKKLVVSDLANIEGRKLVWLSGEQWKLQMFRDFDAGRLKFDNYVMAYAKAFRVDPSDVDEFMRQLGKVMELALGYQGGVGAFAAMAVTYGMDLDELAERAWPVLLPEIINDSRQKRGWALKDSKRKAMVEGIAEKTWLVLQSLVTLWRQAHPETVKYWDLMEQSARAAIENPGIEFEAGKIVFDRRGNWLRMRLPSGRYQCYPSPEISERGEISYVGINQYTRQWARIKTYAGKLTENADQGSSRDVFKAGEMRANRAGYDGVLVVHDELVAETPDTEMYDPIELSMFLSTNDEWNEGLPLSAKGWEGYRYKKG